MILESRKKLPMASEELKNICMESATDFVLSTSILDDSASMLVDRVRSDTISSTAARGVLEIISYMSIFAVAENEANKEGFTLMDWSKRP